MELVMAVNTLAYMRSLYIYCHIISCLHMNKSPEHTHIHTSTLDTAFHTYHMLMSGNNICISAFVAASSRPSVCLCGVCTRVCVCMCGLWDLAWQM